MLDILFYFLSIIIVFTRHGLIKSARGIQLSVRNCEKFKKKPTTFTPCPFELRRIVHAVHDTRVIFGRYSRL